MTPALALPAAAFLAALLAAIAAGRQRQEVCAYLRLAAALAAAVALASVLAHAGIAAGLVSAVGLLAAALAPPALAIAARAPSGKPWSAGASALALGLACLVGVGAAATGSVLLAVMPLMLSALALTLRAVRPPRHRGALLRGMGALALVAAAASWLAGGHTSFALFLSAAVLGLTAVPAQKRRSRMIAVGSLRAR